MLFVKNFRYFSAHVSVKTKFLEKNILKRVYGNRSGYFRHDSQTIPT